MKKKKKKKGSDKSKLKPSEMGFIHCSPCNPSSHLIMVKTSFPLTEICNLHPIIQLYIWLYLHIYFNHNTFLQLKSPHQNTNNYLHTKLNKSCWKTQPHIFPLLLIKPITNYTYICILWELWINNDCCDDRSSYKFALQGEGGDG